MLILKSSRMAIWEDGRVLARRRVDFLRDFSDNLPRVGQTALCQYLFPSTCQTY